MWRLRFKGNGFAWVPVKTGGRASIYCPAPAPLDGQPKPARTGDSPHLPASSEGLQREKVQVQIVSHYRLGLAISFHPVRVLRVDWNIFSFCANSSTF